MPTTVSGPGRTLHQCAAEDHCDGHARERTRQDQPNYPQVWIQSGFDLSHTGLQVVSRDQSRLDFSTAAFTGTVAVTMLNACPGSRRTGGEAVLYLGLCQTLSTFPLVVIRL